MIGMTEWLAPLPAGGAGGGWFWAGRPTDEVLQLRCSDVYPRVTGTQEDGSGSLFFCVFLLHVCFP